MAAGKPSKRRKKRMIRRILSLFLIALLLLVGWNYLRPLFSDETITTYEAYVAFKGDIETFNSYSATLGVLHSEVLSNSRQVTSVKKVYVQAGQEVSEGDKLMQLESGDVLKAGINGTVNEIRFGEGEWIWPNVSLIQICDLKNLQVSLSVDEYDISNVAAGEKCYVTIVPLGLQFETTIAHVDRSSAGSSSVAFYSVTAELTVPENVLPGMTASVSIPAEAVHDALLLEMAALSFDESSAPYVLVRNGENYEKRMIETGLSDGMNVQILSGLKEGDEVYRVSGEEKAVTAVSLTEIYRKLAGETVVIRDQTDSGRSGMGTNGRRGLPDGMTMPEGFTMPEGMTAPEGFAGPMGMEQPESSAAPENTDSVAEPESTEKPEAFAMPEGFTPPQGFEMPEGFTAPEGFEMPGGAFPGRREEQQTDPSQTEQSSNGQEEAGQEGNRPSREGAPAFSPDQESTRSNQP